MEIDKTDQAGKWSGGYVLHACEYVGAAIWWDCTVSMDASATQIASVSRDIPECIVFVNSPSVRAGEEDLLETGESGKDTGVPEVMLVNAESADSVRGDEDA